MYLKKLRLTDYRNIKHLDINLNPHVNIFYGDNGQGKTNIVESIYLLAKASSFRTSYTKELISNNFESTTVEGNVALSKNSKKHKIIITKNGKACFIDDIAITKFSEYLGNMQAIAFSPEDVSIFKESPSYRRHFMDSELSSLFPLYIRQLIVFKNVLEQRNDHLKNRLKFDSNLIEVLDDKLIESSYDIYLRRKWLVDKLCEFATIIYQQLAGNGHKIKIVYKTFLQAKFKDEYLTKGKQILKANLIKDRDKTFTNVGIHKDDFVVYLDDLQIDMYASQGQQRLVSLSLKLAVSEIVNKACKERPIIILDDAFSELDAQKKMQLYKYVSTTSQVFITCTDYKEINGDNTSQSSIFKVKNGEIIERKVS